MRIVAIIEARMNSSRLAGKVMLKWRDQFMLQVMLERLHQVNGLDSVVVATTTNPSDDLLVERLHNLGVSTFRGSEEDVLGRVAGAAEQFQAEIIVSLTGDCPLIDFRIVEECLTEFRTRRADVITNCRIRSFPIGMDTQVFSRSIIDWANSMAIKPEEREHTGLFFERNRDKINLVDIVAESELYYPNLGLVLDEQEDYVFILQILELFSPDILFSCRDIIEAINQKKIKVTNNSVFRRSID